MKPITVPTQLANKRLKNFREVELGFTKKIAIDEKDVSLKNLNLFSHRLKSYKTFLMQIIPSKLIHHRRFLQRKPSILFFNLLYSSISWV